MKVKIIIIIIVLVLLNIFAFYFLKTDTGIAFLESATGRKLSKTENTTNTAITNEKIKEFNELNDTRYGNHTIKEWRELVRLYFKNVLFTEPDVIETKIEDEVLHISVWNNKKVINYYEIDKDTGIGIDLITTVSVDFESQKAVPFYDNIDFTDNLFVAIGYVLDDEENAFSHKYIPSPKAYEYLERIDHRDFANQQEGYGNRFVLIPKDSDVKITVYNCHIGDDGELYTDDEVTESHMPFIILDDYIEYIPRIAIKLEYNGFECMFPVTFSGENGKLVLEGVESEVLDISPYTGLEE